MSTFKNKNSFRTIEAKVVQNLKNNKARPKFTGSYKKACIRNSLKNKDIFRKVEIIASTGLHSLVDSAQRESKPSIN